jgi:hypothetical protein
MPEDPCMRPYVMEHPEVNYAARHGAVEDAQVERAFSTLLMTLLIATPKQQHPQEHVHHYLRGGTGAHAGTPRSVQSRWDSVEARHTGYPFVLLPLPVCSSENLRMGVEGVQTVP